MRSPVGARRALWIACGALARELAALRRLAGWQHVEITCLPPELHQRPEQIPARVRALLEATAGRYDEVFVAYADCGTGGGLDAVLGEYGAERLPGAHCYEVFAGSAGFEALQQAEPGTFYLTDFLVRHFERLVIRSLGLDRHPELRSAYFGHYRRVVYLRQSPSPELEAAARRCAERLGLACEIRWTGLAGLDRALRRARTRQDPAEATRASGTMP